MKLMPQEIEVRYILPSLRKEFAIALAKHKIQQNEIAKMLNITPAAISQYLSEKRGSTKFKEEVKRDITDSVDKIIKKYSTTHKELYKISSKIKKSSSMCEIHRLYDDVPKECNFCFENDK